MTPYEEIHAKYAKAQAEIEDLRGALQAVLLSLGVALDLLAPPANPDKAWAHVEDAMTVVMEELEDDTETAA